MPLEFWYACLAIKFSGFLWVAEHGPHHCYRDYGFPKKNIDASKCNSLDRNQDSTLQFPVILLLYNNSFLCSVYSATQTFLLGVSARSENFLSYVLTALSIFFFLIESNREVLSWLFDVFAKGLVGRWNCICCSSPSFTSPFFTSICSLIIFWFCRTFPFSTFSFSGNFPFFINRGDVNGGEGNEVKGSESLLLSEEGDVLLGAFSGTNFEEDDWTIDSGLPPLFFEFKFLFMLLLMSECGGAVGSLVSLINLSCDSYEGVRTSKIEQTFKCNKESWWKYLFSFHFVHKPYITFKVLSAQKRNKIVIMITLRGV